jgi:uncharacterized protein with FMN-binding domain
MKRRVVMVALIGASLFFVTRFHRPVPDIVVVVEEPNPTTTVPFGATVTRPRPDSTLAPTTTTTAPGPATTVTLPDDIDGLEVFEGARVRTNWGWVKVEISVLEGTMVDVELVMIPRATKRSEALTREYEPVLREEALVTQSPEVHTISGATELSYGYRVSLKQAMSEAGLWAPSEE